MLANPTPWPPPHTSSWQRREGRIICIGGLSCHWVFFSPLCAVGGPVGRSLRKEWQEQRIGVGWNRRLGTDTQVWGTVQWDIPSRTREELTCSLFKSCKGEQRLVEVARVSEDSKRKSSQMRKTSVSPCLHPPPHPDTWEVSGSFPEEGKRSESKGHFSAPWGPWGCGQSLSRWGRWEMEILSWNALE